MLEVIEIVTKNLGISRYAIAKKLGIDLRSLLCAERSRTPLALAIVGALVDLAGPEAVASELARRGAELPTIVAARKRMQPSKRKQPSARRRP